MDANFSFNSSKKYLLLLAALFVLVTVYAFFKPLAISIDSIYGFLAGKGTLQGHFNRVAQVTTTDLNHTDYIFESWWSPGQWMYPGLLKLATGASLGNASIVVTTLSAFFGLLGFYRLFGRFNFPPLINILSLLLIFASCTFYYSFIIYQGGEVLEFAFFPWFVFYILRIRHIHFFSLLVTALLFLLCFVSKTTMVVYCSIVLLHRAFYPSLLRFLPTKKIKPDKNWLFLIPLLLCTIFIQRYFLSLGPKPVFFDHFEMTAKALLLPLSSPVTSVISIQQWIMRFDKLGGSNGAGALVSTCAYGLALAVWIAALIAIFKEKKISSEYKSLLIFLYTGTSIFFITAYLFNADIDLNSRHFKLLGFLCLPASLTVLSRLKNPVVIGVATCLCVLISIADFIYLKEKWTVGKYPGVNGFYRNSSDLQKMDFLDENAYKKLILLDKGLMTRGSPPAIFFVEGHVDIAMDLLHRNIVEEPGGDISEKIYHGKGPVIIVCIAKRETADYRSLMKMKFPDYDYFQQIDETPYYLLLKLSNIP